MPRLKISYGFVPHAWIVYNFIVNPMSKMAVSL